MDPELARIVRAALGGAVEAVVRSAGPKAVVKEVVSAVAAAAKQGQPTFPADPPAPGGTAGPPPPRPAPRAQPATGLAPTTLDTLAAARARLDSATANGSVGEIMSALFAYEQAESKHHEQELLAQGFPPATVARLVAERKAQMAQENVQMLSNMSAIGHGVAMGVINNIRP